MDIKKNIFLTYQTYEILANPQLWQSIPAVSSTYQTYEILANPQLKEPATFNDVTYQTYEILANPQPIIFIKSNSKPIKLTKF